MPHSTVDVIKKSFSMVEQLNLNDIRRPIRESSKNIGKKLSKIVENFETIYQVTFELNGVKLHTLKLNLKNINDEIFRGML